jgi:hypothetical protein
LPWWGQKLQKTAWRQTNAMEILEKLISNATIFRTLTGMSRKNFAEI